MNKKQSDHVKICSNCKNLILPAIFFYHEQTENNKFNVFCGNCGLRISLNRLSKLANSIKENF